MLFFGSHARRLTSVASVLVTLGACATSTSTIQVRTDGRLRVTPQEFTYDVGCSFASGADTELGHYVATLLDLGAGDGGGKPEVSGSATAARCTSSTTFSTTADESLIELEHRYAVIIDGYAGTTPPKVDGKRSVEWAAPNWQWLCGIGGLSETQLEELLTEAQSLAIGEQPVVPAPSAVPDAAVSTWDAAAPTMATVPTDTAGSTWDATTAPTLATVPTDTASSTWDAAAPTMATVPTDAAVSTAPPIDETVADAAVPGDASVASTGDTTAISSAMTTSMAKTSDASTVTASSESSSAVANASDAGGASTSAETSATGETGADRWLAALLAAAADDDFAPPAKVVAGGQSGLRGCVPLF